MKVAVTGATGFVGRYLVRELLENEHEVRAWFRSEDSKRGLEDLDIDWVQGQLDDEESANKLISGVDAVIHAGLNRPSGSWSMSGRAMLPWAQTNLMGTLKLITEAKEGGVGRFIFVSTCAVHDRILSDRTLDESHPLWPYSHYGAHKAALEKFVHSFGFGEDYCICSVRPTGIYGEKQVFENSKWFPLIRSVKRGETVEVTRGGKEVHVRDVARVLNQFLALPEEKIKGEAFNCYDMYISQYMVANLVKELTGSSSEITGEPISPKNQISTDKIRELGVSFGGEGLFKETIEALTEKA